MHLLIEKCRHYTTNLTKSVKYFTTYLKDSIDQASEDLPLVLRRDARLAVIAAAADVIVDVVDVAAAAVEALATKKRHLLVVPQDLAT